MKTCTFVTLQLENKLLKACGWYLTNCCDVLCKLELARLLVAVLDCCDPSFIASERISEQTLSCSLEGRVL